MRRTLSLRRIIALPALVLAVFIGNAVGFAADERSGFVDHVYTDEQGDHKYVVFVPDNYAPDKKWPVVLFLHGAGERGTDGRKQLSVGLGAVVAAQSPGVGYLIVFPQCEDTEGRILTAWDANRADGQRALSILNHVEQTYNVDSNQRILTGWSMGGYGAWSLAAAMPEHWSAVVPVSGGGQPQWGPKLKDVPIWAFHGADDAVVRADESRTMIEAVRAAGGKPRYTEVTGSGHHVWTLAYRHEPLKRWMLNPSVGDSLDTIFRAKPGTRPPSSADDQLPFVAAVEIPNAAHVRLGNEMLEALAYSIPQRVPADLLVGRIGDINESTTASGRSFRVRFTDVTYSGRVARARIHAYRADRLNIQLGLQDVRLRIGTTYLVGSGRSAVAGPIHITIGHRRPVWLSLALEPYVENRRLRTKLIASRFDIPNDNWRVAPPAGVSASGLGMTRERVSNGLVSGIYAKKGRIEREVGAIVPSILERLEENLELNDVTDVITAFWPLPVYRPRLRAWPQDVSTDDKGVSISFGVSAAALEPGSAPQTPVIVEPAGLPLSDVEQSTALEVGLSPNVLEPLTDMLIDAGIARIHVQDIPGTSFSPLGELSSLAEAIPDLKRYAVGTEIWSELVLVDPMQILDRPEVAPLSTDTFEPIGQQTRQSGTFIRNVRGTFAQNDANVEPPAESLPADDASAANAPGQGGFRIDAPRAIISIAVREPNGGSDWTPLAEFEFAIRQNATARAIGSERAQPSLRLDWSGDPEILATGRFAPGYEPQDPTLRVEKIREMFLAGWRGWTQAGPASEVAIPDVDFGASKLRLSGVEWRPPRLAVRFAPPELEIANSFSEPLVYETKSPYSRWGGPYTLSPGKSHRYRVPYPLIYRRNVAGQYEMFTLPAGSRSEFRVPSSATVPGLYRLREPISEPPQAHVGPGTGAAGDDGS